MTRVWPGLPYGRLANFLHVTDVHTGVSIYQARRMAKVITDAASLLLTDNLDGIAETGDAINNGDLTTTGEASEDATYLQWQRDFMAATGVPWAQCFGNHDGAGQFRDANEWAATYGLPSPRYVIKFGSVNMVHLAPDAIYNDDGTKPYGTVAIRLSDANVAWLDDTLTSLGSEPCVVACHAPLPGGTAQTAGIVNTVSYGAAATDLLNVLDSHHSHLAAYICGHTHVQPDSAETFQLVSTGAHQIVHVNAGWLGAYKTPSISGAAQAPYRPITGLGITVLDDLSVQCRWRNFGAQQWDAPRGSRIMTLAGA